MLGKAFGRDMTDWNLEHKKEMMGKNICGLPSERPDIFRGFLNLLDLRHHRQIAKVCSALQLPLFATSIILRKILSRSNVIRDLCGTE